MEENKRFMPPPPRELRKFPTQTQTESSSVKVSNQPQNVQTPPQNAQPQFVGQNAQAHPVAKQNLQQSVLPPKAQSQSQQTANSSMFDLGQDESVQKEFLREEVQESFESKNQAAQAKMKFDWNDVTNWFGFLFSVGLSVLFVYLLII